MKIASLQYCCDFSKDPREKIANLVKEQAKQGVNLLLFPEYAGDEMPSGRIELLQELSHRHHIYICSGSQVVHSHNRSHFFSPNKKVGYQDKCILTPEEVGEGILTPSNTLHLFETDFGKIGICICYDIEFPTLVRKLTDAGAKLLLVPSYTSSVHGFYRVFLSCRARALENQCYVASSALVGPTKDEIAYGAAAICTPIDEGFPEDGLLAMGKRDKVESVIATLDFKKLEQVRSQGKTRNYIDSKTLDHREITLESLDLR